VLKGLRDFLLRGNVVDLAVAVVVGAAFTGVVTAFVKDLLTPLIAAVGGQPDFAGLYFTINNSKFLFGDFINAIVSFVIVAAVVYFLVVVPMGRLMALSRRKEEAALPTTRPCPYCLSSIPLAATRCAYCTAEVPTAVSPN
jgi:large conductance mechanosensitive channel